MAEEDNETFIRRWFEEVWNQRSEAAIDEMCAEDIVANGLNDAEGNPIRGIEAYKNLHRAFVSAYPNLKITVEDTISEGDKIAARCSVTGTHEGEGLGLAPTNQQVDFSGLVFVRL